MTKKKRGSSSVYRTGTDSVKIRLIVLTVLAALLLLTALCAKYICPYDPYEQNLLLAKQPAGAGASAGNRPLWTGYVFQDSDSRNYQYFFHTDPGEHYNSNGNLCGNYLAAGGEALWMLFL